MDKSNLSLGFADLTFNTGNKDGVEMLPKFNKIARNGKMGANMEGIINGLGEAAEAEYRHEEFQRDTNTSLDAIQAVIGLQHSSILLSPQHRPGSRP